MPFCTSPMACPRCGRTNFYKNDRCYACGIIFSLGVDAATPATIADLRARTQAFVREVLPGLDVNDSLAFENVVKNIVDELRFITDFDHVV